MNRADFVGLYHVQFPRVFLYLLLRLWNRNAAEESTAKVFAVALTALRTGTDPMQVGSWLIGIADHLVDRRASRSLKIKVETVDHAGPQVAVGMAIRRTLGGGQIPVRSVGSGRSSPWWNWICIRR